MLKRIFFSLFFLMVTYSNAQELIYKSNGNILNTENNKISPDKVRELLANNENLLKEYNSGRSKKTAGNILLIGGMGLLAGDLMIGLFSPYDVEEPNKRVYPSALTYIGLTSVLVAIPVKIGFSKKIKNVVSEYNNQNTTGYKQVDYKKIEFITNSNGLGFRLTLN